MNQHIQLDCESTFKRCIYLTLSWHCYRISVDDIQGKTSKICVFTSIGMFAAIAHGWHACGDCVRLPCLWRLCLACVWRLCMVAMFVAIVFGIRVAIVHGCHVCGDCVWHSCPLIFWIVPSLLPQGDDGTLQTKEECGCLNLDL